MAAASKTSRYSVWDIAVEGLLSDLRHKVDADCSEGSAYSGALDEARCVVAEG